jgi:hypothetical protein
MITEIEIEVQDIEEKECKPVTITTVTPVTIRQPLETIYINSRKRIFLQVAFILTR